MTTFVFCCRKLIVHIHVFRRRTMKVPAFSNFLISLKSLIYPEKLDFIGNFNVLTGHFFIENWDLSADVWKLLGQRKETRPVYVQKKETIYGHFLICYLSLFLLRILEIKCFKNEISSYDLVNFMRDFKVVDKGDGTYINISQNQRNYS